MSTTIRDPGASGGGAGGSPGGGDGPLITGIQHDALIGDPTAPTVGFPLALKKPAGETAHDLIVNAQNWARGYFEEVDGYWVPVCPSTQQVPGPKGDEGPPGPPGPQGPQGPAGGGGAPPTGKCGGGGLGGGVGHGGSGDPTGGGGIPANTDPGAGDGSFGGDGGGSGGQPAIPGDGGLTPCDSPVPAPSAEHLAAWQPSDMGSVTAWLQPSAGRTALRIARPLPYNKDLHQRVRLGGGPILAATAGRRAPLVPAGGIPLVDPHDFNRSMTFADAITGIVNRAVNPLISLMNERFPFGPNTVDHAGLSLPTQPDASKIRHDLLPTGTILQIGRPASLTSSVSTDRVAQPHIIAVDPRTRAKVAKPLLDYIPDRLLGRGYAGESIVQRFDTGEAAHESIASKPYVGWDGVKKTLAMRGADLDLDHVISPTFTDTTDPTKLLAFDVSGISTQTSRAFKAGDFDTSFAKTGGAEGIVAVTKAGGYLDSSFIPGGSGGGTVSFDDTLFTLFRHGFPTRTLALSLTGLSAARTRTLLDDSLTESTSGAAHSIPVTGAAVTLDASWAWAHTGDVTSSAGSAATTVAKINGTTVNGATTTCGAGKTGYLPLLNASGYLDATGLPALTGDLTTPGGSVATTLATVNTNVGTFGTASKVAAVTANAKGLITGVSETSIAIDAAAVTTGTLPIARGGTGITTVPTAGQIAVGNAGGTAWAVVSPSGDFTLAATGVATLKSVGTAGTYGDASHVAAITTDAQGRVSGASATAIAIDAGAVTSGTLPIARGGTGITTVPSAGQLLIGNAGGTAWATQALSADATLSSAGALTLATVATAGTTGDASHVPAITIDAKGRVTSAVSTAISVARSALTDHLPAGHMTGFAAKYVDATDITIGVGSCRDSTDTTDLVNSATRTLSQTEGGGGANLGTDSETITPTGTGSGSTITASSTVFHIGIPFKDLAVPLTIGTYSSSSTTLTGVGTKFLTELAPGDLVGTLTTYGFSRVVSIASDTSCTVAAAFPGGNIPSLTATSLVRIENPTISCRASNTLTINTISADGLTIVCSGSVGTQAAGGTITIGGAPQAGSIWMYVWMTNLGLYLSTQRTQPYAGTTYRRLPISIFLDGSGNIRQFNCVGNSGDRTTYWTDIYTSAPSNEILATASPATTFTQISGPYIAPPTATLVLLDANVGDATASSANDNSVWFRVTGTTPTNRFPSTSALGRSPATAGTPIQSSNGFAEFPWNSAGTMDYRVAVALTAGSAAITAQGWRESA